MKFTSLFKLTVVFNIITANFVTMPSANANTFDEKEIAQDQIIAIAAPYRHGYNLVVIEQMPGQYKCWEEQGIAPVIVNPLLMNFDFTGHCGRATDSNGYSIRIGGEEKGSDYLLNIVEQGNELVLIATQRDPNKAPITIGRTHGKSDTVTKIFLNPGWRFTKRSYQGKELSHYYFSEGLSPVANTTAQPSSQAVETNTVNTTTQQAASLTIENVSTPQESDQLF